MSNRVRHFMAQEVKAVLPLLQDGYHAVARFQTNRNPENKEQLELYLLELGQALRVFKEIVQINKQDYFDAILQEDLAISDRIIALDTAVGAMHIEFSVPRMYMHRETKALKNALERIRISKADSVAPKMPEALCTGIAASAGIATGKVKQIRKDSDYKHVAEGAIIVTRMTRPELVFSLDKAAAIVTDIGGLLCHAAIVAREKQIPCVVGTGNATELLKDKQLIEVNGSTGIVKAVQKHLS